MSELNEKRFELDNTGMILDNLTGEFYPTYNMDRIVMLLNKECDRADRIVESFTDEELLKLKWQRDIYKRFSEETMKVLNKYEISSLEKLDRMLFEQKVW